MDQWTLWQLIDSAFPTGSLGHSGGLESTYQHGLVRGEEDLVAYMEMTLQQCAAGAVPIAAEVTRKPERFAELDQLQAAMILNPVANRASTSQGRGMLSMARRVFSPRGLESLGSYGGPAHFAPVFGVVVASLGGDDRLCAEGLLFCQLRLSLSAAVRLGIMGPIAAQQLQHRLAARARELAEGCFRLGPDEATAISPLHDLVLAAHDSAYSRMFLS
jgi:urease accessory protein